MHSKETLPQCTDAYRAQEDPRRRHLGASVIGIDCARLIWYNFRWATIPQHEGRLLRLFNRGHLEEGRFIALLKMLGFEVWQHVNGEQIRVSSVNGHFGGSMDCVLRGLDEMPDTALLGEFKTHGDKSFVKMAGDNWDEHWRNPTAVAFTGEGVRHTKFEHYVQMQSYMGLAKLPSALYLAVNKNTDSIYAEVVSFDRAIFEAFQKRAWDIIFASDPLPRIKEDRTWWKCKMCPLHGVCWDKVVPEKSCRTCEHARLGLEGSWICVRGLPVGAKTPSDRELSEEAQREACSHYSLLPSMR